MRADSVNFFKNVLNNSSVFFGTNVLNSSIQLVPGSSSAGHLVVLVTRFGIIRVTAIEIHREIENTEDMDMRSI